MKLIIQIPCFNEEEALPITLADLPRKVPGFSSVEWLVINDGSSDKTGEVAKKASVDYVLNLPEHLGLGRAFSLGLQEALARGADVILNTDADNQYKAENIPKLLQPILDGEADMVIGIRPISTMDEFSPLKKILQKLGSFVVRWISGANVKDVPCGFRAITRKAAMSFDSKIRYTYTIDTIMQVRGKKLKVSSVPITVNPPMRPSRLVRSTGSYVFWSVVSILRLIVLYQILPSLPWKRSQDKQTKK